MATKPELKQLSYSIAHAAAVTDYSVPVIRDAIDKGDITPRYANSKPVIPAAELEAWIHSLPVDKPSRS